MSYLLRVVALSLAGTGALLALQLKVLDQCTNQREIKTLSFLNAVATCVFWVALGAAIAFSFLPDGEVRLDAAVMSTMASMTAASCAGILLVFEVFLCSMIGVDDFTVFVWTSARVAGVAAAVSLAWRAWSEREQRKQEKPKEPPAPDSSYEKLETA